MTGPKVRIKPGTAPTPLRPATDGVPIEEIDLEGNSFRDKRTSSEPIPLIKQTVRKGKVRIKKKSAFKRFTETFFGEDAQQVMDYIVHDVLIPAAKSTLTDLVSGGIEMLLYGDRQGSRTHRDKGRSVVSYSSFYKDRDRDRDRSPRSNRRRGKRIDDIIFDTRGEAEEILSDLVDHLEKYDEVSVADLYDAIGVTSSDFTNHNYGWTSLRGSTVDRVRGGYLLNLPETESLS